MVRLCLNCGDMRKTENKNCVCCGSSNTTEIDELKNVTVGDYINICEISKDGNFIYQMLKLKSENPIEYELKMQQFKQVSNVPKCPHCQSTNIAKISGTERAASIIGLGVFSKKINKSFKCNNCGYTW